MREWKDTLENVSHILSNSIVFGMREWKDTLENVSFVLSNSR